MSIALGVVMDPISQINIVKDTSFAFLLAAQKRGWSLHYMEQDHLYMAGGQARAQMAALKVQDNTEAWYQLDSAEDRPLAELDIVLMRKDPPFDSEYIYSTYILEAAEREGCLVVNKPQSLRDCNEKLFATQFPQCCPELTVSRDAAVLRAFHAQHGDVIFKPLDGMGGEGIFRARADDPNLGSIIETLTLNGKRQIMAQRFIPDIQQGDKRILMINGQAVPYCLARIPAKGETRGNLAAGGRGEARPLSERDQWIAQQVGPTLKAKGLYFVGLDVIGDYLTEINVTSPTCVQEISRAYDIDIAAQLMQTLEQALQEHREQHA